MNELRDPSHHTETAEATAAKQLRLQQEQDTHDAQQNTNKKEHGFKDSPPASEAKPSQHLRKPSLEKDMQLKPRFEAPHYKGSGKLEGFATVITGGDSGIGRAVAVLFAREGADVALIYLNEHADAEETRTHIEAEGGRCLLLPGDVKDASFCKEAVQKVVTDWGRLDVLVNNAAFQEHSDALIDLSEERFDETMKTNVYGYFHMAKAALPHLKAGSSIINTGSVTGLRGSKALVDYSTTKGAIHAFTKALASQLVDKGIRVNAVAPGPVWTPLNPADKAAEDIVDFGSDTDFGRSAHPEELSPAYVFLAAPCCSSYITGMVLPITGNAGDGA